MIRRQKACRTRKKREKRGWPQTGIQCRFERKKSFTGDSRFPGQIWDLTVVWMRSQRIPMAYDFSFRYKERYGNNAGFGGISLGSTATAIVNMSAVAKQYGAAHRAFIVMPLVCGFLHCNAIGGACVYARANDASSE